MSDIMASEASIYQLTAVLKFYMNQNMVAKNYMNQNMVAKNYSRAYKKISVT